MCLLFVAYQANPRFPLIAAANRDEFYARPTQPLTQWPERPRIYAGRDLQEGGTWMGATTNGRFAAVTNHRSGPREAAQLSRGSLVRSFLESELSVDDFAAALEPTSQSYGGFNLMMLADSTLAYFSNRKEPQYQRLTPGIYGLSNGLLNTPWPKLTAGKRRFTSAITGPNQDELWALLADDAAAPDYLLPDTGVGVEVERLLSSAFITSKDYGTRSSTLLLHDANGVTQMWEKTFEKGVYQSEVSLSFPSPLAAPAIAGSDT
ncbi:NRDE family protein [Hahella aquimaris]|uniref:NRDE family protein n=1 Tax=Hahella sp. HNIBRBA332 TaxID=3015983 RepID=UPI00273BC5EE|nr:NRDE family protein [Hahella sp. HNIBRBA332]WLQ14124.1 NRDE family protein [Hahella sp. HNIBRBA332]